MKKLFVAGAALAALLAVSAASAADIPVRPHFKAPPPPPVFNWSGFYIGATVGYGFGDNNHVNQTNLGRSETFDIDGFVAGGTIGWNWQRPGSAFVWGIEADISYSDINGVLPVSPGFGCATGCFTEVKWFGTVRGRLGIARDRALFYVTGGLAYGNVEGSLPPFIPPGSETAVGWTAGAGMEFAIGHRWSMKLEYLYVDLGDAVYAPNFVGNVIAVDNVEFSVVRLGVNYRW
jgi:outer membrane immunogenic protein